MFDKVKHLGKIMAIQKELSKVVVEAQKAGGKVKIVMRGDMRVESVSIDNELTADGRREQLESYLKDCIQEAIANTQRELMNKVKGMGGTGLPGLFP
jgi:DNA-binding protein YbaB